MTPRHTPADNTPSKLTVALTPFGPTPAVFERIAGKLLRLPALKKRLHKTRSRLLSIAPLEAEPEDKSRRAAAPGRFRATIYDYTNNVTILVDGGIATPGRIEIVESSSQPLPTREEFAEAVEILSADADLGPGIRTERLRPYPPMPPLLGEPRPDGRTERTLAVGLLPAEGARHEIVGVNLSRRTVIRFDRQTPPTSAAGRPICGLPYSGQTTARNAAGQVWVTVRQGATTLWRFLVVRPAASSGTNGSGVELRFVDYRGKRVLYRAHVPILNVKYDGDACGPYRDWQNEEGMIQAAGTDVAPGFRLCPAPATTILDSGSDTGNFLGTAIYVQGQEAVLVCEMEAGWYRYVSEWRLHANGTIRPRFGFSAVSSSCVCNVHHHHAYWRLDFDIRTAGNNRVREFNDPPLGSSKWHTKNFEIRRPRDPGRQRKWRVEDSSTGQGYEIIPGQDDGVATASPDWPFPKGDVWILRYRGSEIDDGSVAVGPPYEAGLDMWVNGESVLNQDVVIWYGAHFTHDVSHEHPGSHGHIVGPALKPVNW
jgi:Copper amine oxidase, enzyme domain